MGFEGRVRELQHIYEDGCGLLGKESRRDALVLLKWVTVVRLAQMQGAVETLCRSCLADSVIHLASLLLDE